MNQKTISVLAMAMSILTLFDTEKWDLGNFVTTPLFINLYEKDSRGKTYILIVSFKLLELLKSNLTRSPFT